MAIAMRYEVKALLLLCLALLSYGADGASRGLLNSHGGRRGLADAGAATVFDVTSYGATADDKTDNVEAFMKAWVAACDSTVAAKVVIPPGAYVVGQVAFQGPCKSPEPIIFELQGTVKALNDISAYPSGEWFMFEDINGLIIRGGGTFNGQGVNVWRYNDCKKSSDCQLLPASIKLHKVNHTIVEEINSVDSMSFHFFITNCYNTTVQRINITAPANSPNTDGIHLSGSDLVNLASTTIGTGDDCISIGQGNTNISISDVFCGPGHGISIGSLGKYPDEEDVRGINVRNCTLFNTTNGVRIKTWPASPPSEASGIIFEDIIMDSVKNPIIIDQKYGSHTSKPSNVKISDVHYKNIRGSSTSDVAVKLMCSEIVPCQGVELVDIDLTYIGKSTKVSSLSSSCLNTDKIAYGGKQNPPACP